MRFLIVAALSVLTSTQVHAAELPPDSEYVVVRDGHLSVDGQRQRYWAVIGKLYSNAGVTPRDSAEERQQKVETARKGTEVLLQRFSDLGFNAARLWTAIPGGDYEVGDGSAADDVDYFIKRAKERGMRLWMAGMNRVGNATPDDVNIIDEPATAEAWRQAVASAENGRMGIRNNPARIWDPRLEAIGIRQMTAIATHLNKHTGLRWCDDPVFAVWELSNEEWWMRRMLGGSWQKLPPFFRNQLVAKWNDFLKQKYGTQEKLAAAWTSVLPGENLEQGTILLTPIATPTSAEVSMNDSNPQARAALQVLDQKYSRADFAEQRGSDVLEFLVGLHVAHKQREAAAIKPLGKSTRLAPMIYDTGIGYEIQSQYLHQLADAVAHDAYVNGGGPDLAQRLLAAERETDPQQKLRVTQEAERIAGNVDAPGGSKWVNWLLKPPGISQGVPWLEHNRVEGKPYLCYETQIQQPAKYRADFPLRIAALASIQDWDFICWHYFGDGSLDRAGVTERPFERAMDISTGGHPQGYHYTYDEVQSATMHAAAYMFRDGLLAPAKSPTRFIYGRKSLYDPRSMDYGGSYGMTGLNMLQTVYQYGSRIEIDLAREEDAVIGPMVKIQDRHTHNPYQPTDQIIFDWKQGTLTMTSPSVAAFTGLMANVGDELRFGNGVSLSNVTVHNAPGMFDPVGEDEKFIAFTLCSTDGQPLSQAKTAAMALVSTSYNTGFKLGAAGQPAVGGTLPVLVARVSGTVQSQYLEGMRYTFRDWHMNELATGTISGGKLEIPADQPIFIIELARP